MKPNIHTILEDLADYIYNLSYADLPNEVIEKTKTILLHNLSTAYDGFYQESSQTALSIVEKDIQSKGKTTIICRGSKFAPIESAFANAIMMHSIQQEDTHPTGLHPGPLAIPTATSLGEQENKEGKDLITSIVLGFDINLRMGEVSKPTTFAFRATSLFGVLGAATASAKMLDLDRQQIINALASATNLSSGLSESWLHGTFEWLFTVGLAARNGIMSALIARRGVQCSKSSIEGEKGFFRAYYGYIPEDVNKITESLGKRFCLLDSQLKRYTAVTPNQSILQTVLKLVKKENIKSEEVDSIDVVSSPNLWHGSFTKGPFTTVVQAFTSVPCLVGIALMFREVSVDTIKNYRDPRVLEIARNVNIETDTSRKGYSNHDPNILVSITTKNGRSYEMQGERFLSPNRNEIKKRLKQSASKFMPEEKAEGLIEAVEKLEKISITDFTSNLS